MSGHSKWANIRHKKEKTDAQKGRLFTKLGRELMVVAKMYGPDPETNPKLRDVIAKAKANNMPMDKIMGFIKRAAGEIDTTGYEDITYEGYGPGGVAVIVEAMTNNRNRTAGELRHIFDKNGGNLGQTGCVSWMFSRKGVIVIEKESFPDEDFVMEKALEYGAEDFSSEDDIYEIITSPEDFSKVREGLEKDGFTFIRAQIEMIPQTTVKLSSEDAQKMRRLIDMLEDNDDVKEVYHNWEEDEE
uniref:Probable transcriptional regulatory protein ENL71_08710 n=1 Tax=Caldicellulosiruptor owensensis TaxID=55205 RepID=A0A7C5V502_9FIRM